ncbi:E3 ubiquitin-protein ligase mind-bomb-like isoform X2 [Acyrthosiphon pisum]|uniref:RING-type domain-containing protein n=1 Tax=Acyrthosiphon pisum TaxID=7029 RepID=A0A8R2NL10_ACYPI|nr:E3 ubiquitin-protein ligase mind-bomb-like isoform X2 [Acyrthosiphon pisum]
MYAYHFIGIEENIEFVKISENIVREESENAEILVVAIPQMPGEEYDRCFVCLSGRNEDIGSVNILLPCGHGWCCDNCGQQQTNCRICKTPIDDTFSIHIMIGNGQWMNNLNSLLDPTGSNCLCCLRAFREDVPNGKRYVYQSCGHGWRCEDCAIPRPNNCEVCDDTVDDDIQIFIC